MPPKSTPAPESETVETPSVPGLSAETLALVEAMARSMAQSMVAAQVEGAKATADAIQARGGLRDNPMGSPLISVLNPQGDRDFPRPELRCTMTFCGYEIEREMHSVEELTLLNLIEPGHYRVMKTDGSYSTMSVVPQYDSTSQTLRKIDIHLHGVKDKSGMARQNWPSLLVLLSQAMGLPMPPLPVREELPLGRIQGGPATVGLPTMAALGGKFGVTMDGSSEAFLAAESNPVIKRDVAAFLGREVGA